MNNYTGFEYLQIDMANQFGLDKLQFEDRIAWVNTHESNLEGRLSEAEDRFRYAAAVQAYRDTQAGIPSGHLVGMDACASGIQIASALTGCKIGARNTGLTGDRRMDVYQVVTHTMNDLLGIAGSWPKEPVKKATMTFNYGSEQKPREAFGSDTPELEAFYKAVEMVAPGAYSLRNLLIKSWQAFAHHHCWTLPDGFTVMNPVKAMEDTKIEVDELDHASFSYWHGVIAGTETGLSNAANVVHSVDGFVNRELCRRCNYDPLKLGRVEEIIETHLQQDADLLQLARARIHVPAAEGLANRHQFTSLAGIESITSESITNFGPDYLVDLLGLIEETLSRSSFPVISVHDEFKAHANNMNLVRQTYTEIMAEIAESNMLDTILTELTGNPVHFKKLSQDLGDEIRQGNYALS